MGCQILIVAVNGKEQGNEQRNNDQNDPGTFPELGHRKYDHDDKRTDRAKSVDIHLETPLRVIFQVGAMTDYFLTLFQATTFVPADRHSSLRQCKGKEHADSV